MSSTIKFSNRGHVLASVGAAVGIANLVLFPARVFNYGGLAFILVFVLCTLILGVPMMMAETALGKNGQSNPVKAYQGIGGKKWGLAGMFGLTTTCFILSFYIVVAGWALYYLYLYIFQYNEITNAVALALDSNGPSIAGVGQLFGQFVTSFNDVLIYSGLFMLLTIVIVANNIKKGIERISRSTVPLLVVLIIVLIIAIQFIEGANLDYSNFRFDLKALFSIDGSGRIGIIEAVGQSFFSLSIGACSMVAYGSHTDKDTNVHSNAHYIVHTDTVVALLGGLLIIPLFAASDKLGLDPTLVFISLVDAFHSFGAPWGRVIGIIFFVLFNLAILTSTISLLEPTVNYLSDNTKSGRRKYSFILGIIIFLFSIPAVLSFNPNSSSWLTNFLDYGNKSDGTMGYFNFIIDFFGTFCILAGAFILSLFIRYRWTIEGFMNELTVPGFTPSESQRKFLTVSIIWIVPIFMILLFVGECIKVLYKIGALG